MWRQSVPKLPMRMPTTTPAAKLPPPTTPAAQLPPPPLQQPQEQQTDFHHQLLPSRPLISARPKPTCSHLTPCLPTSICEGVTEPSKLAEYGYNISSQADLLEECLQKFAAPSSVMFPSEFIEPRECEDAPPVQLPLTCDPEISRADPPFSCLDGLGCFNHLSCDFFGIEFTAVPVKGDPDPAYLVYGPSALEPDVLRLNVSQEDLIHDFAKLFRETGDLIILMHGFVQSPKSAVIDEIRKGLQKKNPNATIMVVNWRLAADKWLGDYPAAAANAFVVARKTVVLLERLRTIAPNLNPKRFDFYGFSLGGQGVGEMARYFHETTGERIRRLLVLDPAGPCFCENGISPRRDDAEIVEIIHSDVKADGKPFSLGCHLPGDISYYLNGAVQQPGCWQLGPIHDHMCNHRRAPEVLADILSSPKPCAFRENRCSPDEDPRDDSGRKCSGQDSDGFPAQGNLMKPADPIRIRVRKGGKQPFC